MFWLSNSESEGESQGTNNKIKRNIWRIYAIFYISRHMSSGLIQVQKHKQHHCKLQNCPPNYLWYHKNPNIWPHLGLWLKKNFKKKKKPASTWFCQIVLVTYRTGNNKFKLVGCLCFLCETMTCQMHKPGQHTAEICDICKSGLLLSDMKPSAFR